MINFSQLKSNETISKCAFILTCHYVASLIHYYDDDLSLMKIDF